MDKILLQIEPHLFIKFYSLLTEKAYLYITTLNPKIKKGGKGMWEYTYTINDKRVITPLAEIFGQGGKYFYDKLDNYKRSNGEFVPVDARAFFRALIFIFDDPFNYLTKTNSEYFFFDYSSIVYDENKFEKIYNLFLSTPVLSEDHETYLPIKTNNIPQNDINKLIYPFHEKFIKTIELLPYPIIKGDPFITLYRGIDPFSKIISLENISEFHLKNLGKSDFECHIQYKNKIEIPTSFELLGLQNMSLDFNIRGKLSEMLKEKIKSVSEKNEDKILDSIISVKSKNYILRYFTPQILKQYYKLSNEQFENLFPLKQTFQLTAHVDISYNILNDNTEISQVLISFYWPNTDSLGGFPVKQKYFTKDAADFLNYYNEDREYCFKDFYYSNKYSFN